MKRHLPGRKGSLRLPLDPAWTSEDGYIQSVLSFATSSDLFRNLCGGVHILDFLTREPDLYTTVLPLEWRDWFDRVDVDDVLDLLLRTELRDSADVAASATSNPKHSPPSSLLEYVQTIRKHCLQRQFSPVSDNVTDMPRQLSVGMKTKKMHEVTNFAAYVDRLSEDVCQQFQEPISVVDFGSGQNYLGRTLASPPYNKHVVAIERKHHNIAGARTMDVHAKLAQKEKIMRNKKEWKRQMAPKNGIATPRPSPTITPFEEVDAEPSPAPNPMFAAARILNKDFGPENGSMTYIEHDVQDGYLENILYPADHSQGEEEQAPPDIVDSSTIPTSTPVPVNRNPKAMVVSLHSCGNLSHHALRTLTLNPSVCAVAIIGCCYNLLTERLGPATYKLPRLRPNHPRLEATGSAYDLHGFPLSRTLEDFCHPDADGDAQRGVRLNITARMMAVQAPYNWGPEDSEAFFRRHFYRTLLQKILLDVGVVKQCPDPGAAVAGGSITGRNEAGTPLIVGSLRKSCFASFRAYVHGALAKLKSDPVDGAMIASLTQNLTDDVIDDYEQRFMYAKKNLAVIWSLMAFSAGVVESIIVADRWLFLREQQDLVDDCWVDIVFDYKQSPRNFVVVGIKKKQE
ncbi:uncharacterized protein A1O5_00959 [Cladophialophora psammophila CBS 110553]|uniref:Methyltransferase domain-containing protein n=1 Tax=Cladophialophora psammophila CBS 110553 TaxID=1182543 RepID=W9XHN2_9EURO|nr:uncharacterized protein A1O5_00959 [Cladophialophora psammophila CBS 110553]EXJ76451.1 hypothetical protein A1O5_00959 [Cladophialophora psammophila CBS 110553]